MANNKFNVGDEVLFEGHRGIVRGTSYDEWEDGVEWEYAIEFYDYSSMKDLWGCTLEHDCDLIDAGKGKWVVEDNLTGAT